MELVKIINYKFKTKIASRKRKTCLLKITYKIVIYITYLLFI